MKELVIVTGIFFSVITNATHAITAINSSAAAPHINIVYSQAKLTQCAQDTAKNFSNQPLSIAPTECALQQLQITNTSNYPAHAVQITLPIPTHMHPVAFQNMHWLTSMDTKLSTIRTTEYALSAHIEQITPHTTVTIWAKFKLH